MFKRLYRKTKVGSLKDIARVANESACCMLAKLVTAEDGTNVVCTFNWADFFAPHLKKIVGIKSFTTSDFQQMSQELCTQSSTVTMQRAERTYSRIIGPRIHRLFRLSSLQRVCQQSGSGTYLKKYVHFVHLAIKT